jgi:hypothetical protein
MIENMKPTVDYLEKVTRVTWSGEEPVVLSHLSAEIPMLPVSTYYKDSDVYCCYQTQEDPPTCGLSEVHITNTTRIYRFSPGQKPVLVVRFWGDVYIESVEYIGQMAKFILLPMSSISMMLIKYGVSNSNGGFEVVVEFGDKDIRLISIKSLDS